jgi:hypothetical protein
VRATDLLARWGDVRSRFKKVIPTEYKRVLEQQRLAALAASGTDAAGVATTAATVPAARPSETARHLKLVKGR